MSDDPLLTHLDRSWTDLVGRSGIAGGTAELLARLVAADAEPDRCYRDLRHVAHVLDVLHALGQGAREPELLEPAAWFHDAVYDPRARDNEECSAELAVATLAPLSLIVDDPWPISLPKWRLRHKKWIAWSGEPRSFSSGPSLLK